MPIQCYGLHWQYVPSAFQVGMTGKGRLKRTLPVIDLGHQIGIYVLYENKTPVYVGRSNKGDRPGIAGRLYHHGEEKGWSWISFSWFGFRSVDIYGHLDPDNVVDRDLIDTISDIEALLINVVNPVWNCRTGDHAHMEEFFQEVQTTKFITPPPP